MVSPTGGCPCLRSAHFLRPSVASIGGPAAAPSLDSSTSPPKCKDLSFNVNFIGWKTPDSNWKTWVDRMHSSHHSTWIEAGIYDAVVSSKCCIHRHQDLIFDFVDKWSPATNTAVFPWGEATFTLEDAAVLGGFSVVGESVSAPPPADDESQKVMKKLLAARTNLCKSPARKAGHSRWMARFMDGDGDGGGGGGSEIEHEAFLAYWLSRFVFPFTRDSIIKSVFPIAVHLARGTRVALAPAVLAAIYRSLTLLKAAVAAARNQSQTQPKNRDFRVMISAPLALIQVWIWERFPSLRSTNPITIKQSQPRLARWDNSKKSSNRNSLPTIDSAREEFKWRPYSTRTMHNVVSRTIYKDDHGYWAAVTSDLEGLVRCLRASELVSLEPGCIEQYLPHRVAMQFGIDQDLPGHVSRVNVNPDIAWRDYIRPINNGDAKIYIPPRVFEPRVTSRYFKWWQKLNLGWRRTTEIDVDGKLSDDDAFGLKDRENNEEFVAAEKVVHRQSPLSYSCNKGSKRKFVESSSDYNSRVSLSDHRFVAESSSTGIGDCASPVEAFGIGLEERINTIEKLCALLKSGKLDLPLILKSRQ
ncbi:PREDICTED: uncharacterized protein LOC105948714 [Erythranthe guttata]|uniref:uncharacterized protein LOC105948714 n=1 Tax=Erythranthe guttata TaxID=4155 RepID=UPI00064DC0C8|nr:PREDICTED: uncharacterized protein LOC105948714 [Erythranthe guttata]|eukprot:XP_012827397.1 PREDICTED: uncharacterized protein LOC105948714 [Erythranthe guttata]